MDTLRDESAERFLRLVQQRRGTLRICLGLAAGVGKTYRMLQEARELHQHGVDVLLGYVETHGRAGIVAQLPGRPRLPRKRIFYKGHALEEMNLDGIEQRRPQVVVDELAHSNVPGSRHAKRWQDVEELMQRGISVITAVNVQHLESLHDQVLKITGTDVTERVPDRLLKEADEVVNIDLTVGELRARLEEGKIYDPAKVPVALANFFQAENPLRLRRLAVREVAQLLGQQVETAAGGAPAVPAARRNDDRLLACINSNERAAQEIIRKASRLADRLGAAWYVQTGHESAGRIGLATQRHLLLTRGLKVRAKQQQRGLLTFNGPLGTPECFRLLVVHVFLFRSPHLSAFRPPPPARYRPAPAGNAGLRGRFGGRHCRRRRAAAGRGLPVFWL